MKKRLFVVIHTLTDGIQHVVDQTTIAKESGADGVFIIPDYAKGVLIASSREQSLYTMALKERFPDFLIGVNFLREVKDVADELYSIEPNLLQIDGSSLGMLDVLRLPNTEFFCGLAFKYSKKVHLTGRELQRHCEEVSRIATVPTTSGDATGQAANLVKISEIRSYLPKKQRLGIASGVTIENITGYIECGVTDFLVATSLVKTVDANRFDILDPKKIEDMSRVIAYFNQR